MASNYCNSIGSYVVVIYVGHSLFRGNVAKQFGERAKSEKMGEREKQKPEERDLFTKGYHAIPAKRIDDTWNDSGADPPILFLELACCCSKQKSRPSRNERERQREERDRS